MQEKNNGLKPQHKCEPIAVAAMSEGREWWVGKLTERIPEWPVETHCLHLKTPLKDVVFLCNSGDFSQLSVLAAVALGYQIDSSWMASQIEMAKDRVKSLTTPQPDTTNLDDNWKEQLTQLYYKGTNHEELERFVEGLLQKMKN